MSASRPRLRGSFQRRGSERGELVADEGRCEVGTPPAARAHRQELRLWDTDPDGFVVRDAQEKVARC
jgi:hypothetical protein